jgi:hypothetical protein
MEHSPSYGRPEVIVAEEAIYVGRCEIHEKYHWSKTMMRRYLGAPDLVDRARILNAQAAPGFRPRRARSHKAQIALLIPPGRRLGAHRWRDLALARWDVGEYR